MMERLTDEQLTAELDGRIALRDSYIKHGYHGTAAAYDATIMALTELKEWRMAAPQLPQPSVVDEQYQHLSELYHSQEKRLFKIAQRIKGPSFDKYAYSPSQAIDVLESEIFGERECDGRAAMLQGAEPVSQPDELPTKCWCHTCRPVTMTDMRFVVCPKCGNKRCPHANDHRNACTGSSEPGQEGSAYPAAPQQEV